ncbi:type VI secretion system baseplate subunit TssF [Campylobacter helveticus]|uniref:type VI secretion system baseplate subunit TssF n=1 Tax=Campylobacter helveticus TaxID=28898 RepID=UPI00214A88D4|nr:type VI secretion system baseplate subunit TssF [Campylobacter helveticus]MCR2065035.1 type VI secretion system baseplate subunit TssF [Campylobacter helveticus]
MKEDIYYYQKELASLYEMRERFVSQFPKLAPFLSLDGKDPDVERIIENLALLTSKLHKELDENIPYIAESLINIISPNYVNAIPSLCMQEFYFNANSKKNKIHIPKDASIKSKSINGVECEFKSSYELTLHPLKIDEVFLASKEKFYTMTLNLSTTKENLEFKELDLKKFLLYLGDDVYTSSILLLYFHLYLKNIKLIAYESVESFKLDSQCVKRVGFNQNESLLSYDDLGFEAFSLLREYFFLPEKFNFIGIEGLELLQNVRGVKFGIEFSFSKPFPKNCIIRKDLFSLSTTPIVNIFTKNAEPFINDGQKDSYPIFIDRVNTNAYEIIQIKAVKAHNSDTGLRVLKNYKNFERFEFIDENNADFYSLSTKKNSQNQSYKTISFFSTNHSAQTISIETLCSNKNLPTLLKIGEINKLEAIKDVSTKNIKIPSPLRIVPVNGTLLWKLVSILSFSYQTMLDKNAFFNVLESYSFDNDKQSEEICKLLKQSIIEIKAHSAYIIDEYITKKGIRCIISIKDSNFYSLGEVYKLGLVLSHFFASFASINSFCELKIKCLDAKESFEYPVQNGKKANL